MHGKYSFVETLIERLIQQVRKHEKQVKAYDEAFTAMKGTTGYRQVELPPEEIMQAIRRDLEDANPERRGNGCMVYRVNS